MNFDRLAELFERAAQLASPEEIDAFLERECGGDPAMRGQVEGLLDARRTAEDFLASTVRVSALRRPLEKAGDWVDRYHLLEQLGEGGCGVVYLAQQHDPMRRRVALKVIKPGMDSRSIVGRFEAERQALARMEHPNVAKVFDAGITATGRPYFVMELVLGTRITEYCNTERLTVPDRLRLFVKVCHAIQHAHQKGIIHRDIKPANILVTVSNGHPEPKVIDFGIAKAVQGRLTDDSVLTVCEQLLGTPAYMSPEQAASSGADVDTRSDVYSLGVLLYELLAGSPPFETGDLRVMGIDRMLRTLREEDPVPPSIRLRRSDPAVTRRSDTGRVRRRPLPSDLDWIVMKCLEKDRTRRYETANELALDLERHLADEPVLARPPSTLDRWQKTYRRHRVTFLAGATILLALLAGLLASTWQATVARRESLRASRAESSAARDARRARKERDAAWIARAEADRSSRETRRFAYIANLNLAFHAWRDGNLARVNDLLGAQVPAEGEEDLRDFEWRFLRRQARSEIIRYRSVGRTPTYAALFSADGSRIFATHLDDACRVLERDSLETLATLSTNALDLALSRDGRTLAVLSNDGFVEVFDARSLQPLRRIADPASERDRILLSPDGALMAASEDLRIGIWETATGTRVDTLSIPRRAPGIGGFAASPDWTRFLTTDEQFLYLWDRATHAPVARLPGHPGGTYSASFSPDARWLATGGWEDRAIRLWNVASHDLAAVFTNHTGWIGRMDFSPDSTTLASASADHTLRLWDLQEWNQQAVLHHPVDEVWMVAYSPDGSTLVSADRRGGVGLWDARPQPAEPNRIDGPFATGVFTADSRNFVTVTTRGLVQVRDGTSLRELRNWSVPVDDATSLRIGPDASHVAVGRSDGSIDLHDPTSTRPARHLIHAGRRAVVEMVHSPDGSRLASLTEGDFRIWDLATVTSIYHRTNAADPYWGLNPVALSPDGARVAFGGTDLQLRIVNLEEGSERKLAPDLWGVLRLGFSPDGTLLAAAGRDHRVKIWETSNLREVATLKSWRQGAHEIAFHPGGRRLVVALGGGGVRWTDLATAREVGLLPTESSPRELLFAPNGDTLVARFQAGFRFWRAPRWAETDESASPLSSAGPPVAAGISAEDRASTPAFRRASAKAAGILAK